MESKLMKIRFDGFTLPVPGYPADSNPIPRVVAAASPV
jgi:hypothetical protein